MQSRTKKFQLQGNQSDLRCEGNHENSQVMFFQQNQAENQQIRLLCVVCLLNLKSQDPVMKIEEAIEQIKQKHEEHYDIQQEILNRLIQGLAQFSNQITQTKEKILTLFNAITQSILEWFNELSRISIKPLELDLKQELYTIHQKRNFIRKSCFDDNFVQMQSNFSSSIALNLSELNKLIDQSKLKQMLQQICSEFNKINFPSFPQAQELIDVIDRKFQSIQAIDFNFDNQLLFVGSKDYLSSIKLKSDSSASHICYMQDQVFSNISASRKQNVLAASFGNVCGLWQLDKYQQWNNFNYLKTDSNIQFLNLNFKENQIIIQYNLNIAIVQINYVKKSLNFVQQISPNSETDILKINPQWTKFILCQNNQFNVYEQNENIWILSDKIMLTDNLSIEDASFIQNDDIIIKYRIDQQVNSTIIFKQKKILKPNDWANVKIKNKNPYFFPTIYNNQQQLYLYQAQNKYHFIKLQNQCFRFWSQDISFEGDKMITKWSNDGKTLAICNQNTSKIQIYQLIYK